MVSGTKVALTFPSSPTDTRNTPTLVELATEPAAPFFAVDDKARSVNRIAAPSRGITPLSRCEFWFGEAIAPAEMVPVINVEGDGNRLFPEV